LFRESALCKRTIETTIYTENTGRTLNPDSQRTRQLVRWVATERNEVRYLLRFDAISLRTSACPMRVISPARTGWRIVVDSEAS
jgi:hypothetical protein